MSWLVIGWKIFALLTNRLLPFAFVAVLVAYADERQQWRYVWAAGVVAVVAALIWTGQAIVAGALHVS